MSDKCNKEVYEEGIQVFVTHTIDAKNVEKWVKAVAKESGQKVDWHYFGGRAVVLALGDINKVNQSLKKLRSMHDDFYRQDVKKYINHPEETDRMIEGIWSYNGLA